MAEQAGTKIAVIDDEEGLRDLLQVGLGMDGFQVRSAPDGVAGLELIRTWQPDCILLDVMPKIDGFQLVAMIRRITEAPILMLTARSEVRDRIEGLRSGADDYIPKPFDLEELALRVRAAVRRPTMRAVEHITYEDLTIDLRRRHTVARGGRYLKLSAREFDLLVTLARRPKRVFTRDELLDMVWGSERHIAADGRNVHLVSPAKSRCRLSRRAHPYGARRRLHAARLVIGTLRARLVIATASLGVGIMLVFIIVLTLIGGPLISRPIVQSVGDAAADARQMVAAAPAGGADLIRRVVDREMQRGVNVAILPPPEAQRIRPSNPAR